MIQKIRQSVLFKNTFIYTLLQLVNSGIPFLLLPVLTRYLTPEDYGMIATYNTFVGVLSIFVWLSF
jgi:O-antigen/teichoic acid export membrane protein